MDPFRLQRHRHLLERGLVDLRDAAFVDPQHVADFFHGHVVRVVQEDHLLVALRERVDGAGERRLELAVLAHAVGLRVRTRGEILGAVAFLVGARGGRDQPDGAQFHHDAVPPFDADSHLLGDFGFRRSAAEPQGQIVGDGVHLLLAFAEVARGPVELAEAVEDGALDAMLGVAVERHVLGVVEFHHGVEQAEHAGMNQVVEIHMYRKVFVNANGDRFDKWKMVEHDPIADLLGNLRSPPYGHTLHLHRFFPLFSFFGDRICCSGQR
ncbi:hypothetical protein SBA4_4060007 [Candidatus Sulfopaludibacter sp. SbA4]|nr:hypothetical protein SBA4_4060007 [Candidatus Sulfopaludibacter sp. SbA4]